MHHPPSLSARVGWGQEDDGRSLGHLGGLQQGALHLGQVVSGNGGEVMVVRHSLIKPGFELHEKLYELCIDKPVLKVF